MLTEYRTFANWHVLIGACMSIQIIAIGGAPSSYRVVSWLKSCYWDTLVRDSYGTTECGSICVNFNVRPDVEFQLVDWHVCLIELTPSVATTAPPPPPLPPPTAACC
jgi:hypothetical protein